MNKVPYYDPGKIATENLERRRRQGRLQLVPPMMQQEQHKRMYGVVNMDTVMKVIFYIVTPLLVILLLTFYLHLLWIAPVTAITLVGWWLLFGRKKY